MCMIKSDLTCTVKYHIIHHGAYVLLHNNVRKSLNLSESLYR